MTSNPQPVAYTFEPHWIPNDAGGTSWLTIDGERMYEKIPIYEDFDGRRYTLKGGQRDYADEIQTNYVHPHYNLKGQLVSGGYLA